jgi:hypothetical protein
MRQKTAILVAVITLGRFFTQSQADPIYFLVAEPNNPVHNDSYVLPLTEPNDIAHARDLITYGPSAGQPIIVATIACGSDCINRDYLNVNKPAWYWHIASFSYFSDTPVSGYQTLESVNWDCNSAILISCPLYTIVDELGTDPKHWKRNFNSDSDVDFNDFASLGNNWFSNCVAPDWCGGTDIDHSGTVDLNDLGVFTEAWLSPYAALPPPGGPESPCWAWQYQCCGDVDNKVEGTSKTGFYHVGAQDLNIILHGMGHLCWPCWREPNCFLEPPCYNPCLDLDRNGVVDQTDIDIATANYMQQNLPPCPPALICQP